MTEILQDRKEGGVPAVYAQTLEAWNALSDMNWTPDKKFKDIFDGAEYISGDKILDNVHGLFGKHGLLLTLEFTEEIRVDRIGDKYSDRGAICGSEVAVIVTSHLVPTVKSVKDGSEFCFGRYTGAKIGTDASKCDKFPAIAQGMAFKEWITKGNSISKTLSSMEDDGDDQEGRGQYATYAKSQSPETRNNVLARAQASQEKYKPYTSAPTQAKPPVAAPKAAQPAPAKAAPKAAPTVAPATPAEAPKAVEVTPQIKMCDNVLASLKKSLDGGKITQERYDRACEARKAVTDNKSAMAFVSEFELVG